MISINKFRKENTVVYGPRIKKDSTSSTQSLQGFKGSNLYYAITRRISW